MFIVTGGAGFIGANIVEALNRKGSTDILVVDDLTDGTKFRNLVGLQIADYLDKDLFVENIVRKNLRRKPEAIIHQGACSDTTEWNGRYMMENNFEYSRVLLHYCDEHHIPFIYASSAAVYGSGSVFSEAPEHERPLNVYGYSKWLFDEYVRRLSPKSQCQVVGLRYFNVYGPREQNKGKMASVAYHVNQQILDDGKARLFEGSDGYGDGEQRRDFIYVGDAADVNLWFFDSGVSGIFNVGTGRSQSFNEVANAAIDWHGRGQIQYIPFPEHLKGRYQSFTEADISRLREVGYSAPFKTVQDGVREYLGRLAEGI